MGYCIEVLGDGGDAALVEYLARSVDYIAAVGYRRDGVGELLWEEARLEEVDGEGQVVLRPVDDDGQPIKGRHRIRIQPAWIDTIKFY